MSKLKLESTGIRYLKRIVDEQGVVVALASQLTNGNWIAVDLNDKPISDCQFKTASKVKSWVRDNM